MIDAMKRLIARALAEHLQRDHLALITGQVTAVDTTAKRVSVKLLAEGTPTVTIPYLTNLVPVVTEYVYVLRQGSTCLVIGPARLTT